MEHIITMDSHHSSQFHTCILNLTTVGIQLVTLALQRLFWEADICSASLSLLSNREAQHRDHKRPLLFHDLKALNQSIPYSFKIQFNITSQLCQRSKASSCYQICFIKCFCISHFLNVSYMPLLSHPFWVYCRISVSKENKFWNSEFCKFLHSPIIPSLLINSSEKNFFLTSW
jgi:hypothetical protein